MSATQTIFGEPEVESLAIPSSLVWAHPVVAEWFVRRFGTPTEPQEQGWPEIVLGKTTLISAPTGSGKTLAAFLVAIDRLLRLAVEGRLPGETQVVYVSPLKALSNDVQKNLEEPLREIQQLALERGLLCQPIRSGVRTGDTLPSARRSMLKNPPHILVTTPESLYLLLTAEKSRENLRGVRTVIVDEIHAVADDKRGAHLALSLERLETMVRGENSQSPGAMLVGLESGPQRIGLSATQNPIELVADFLSGSGEGRPPATIVQVGQRRELDLGIEVPKNELGSVATNAIWADVYDRMAVLANEHRSTLVFVPTRRMAERIAHAMGERLGEELVAAHHGSLSRHLRLDAEQRLKRGELKLLVATASLELGIDIGSVDLVCQIGTTRAVAVAMQRVGRAGHWLGAVPKGRLFATTRDDLVELSAMVRAMRAGELDRLEVPDKPIDVLMQQMVAACAAEPWREAQLFEVMQRAYPYRNLERAEFDELIAMLHEGVQQSRGRFGAYLLRDGVNGEVQARRGARTIACSNGGAIPDTAVFQVVLQPDGVVIGTVDEDFAVESMAGEIMLLGNTSWRITKIESAGRVLVEDAHGQPPGIPFWRGEAPQRTEVLSGHVAKLREDISVRTMGLMPGYISQATPQVAEVAAWLKAECAVDDTGAEQLINYIVAGRSVLGTVPTTTTIIAERFFDEGGGMQLVLHAPFGGRINKAWGLALRKRFCRGFNFELQAAATDNGLNISLAEQHSFPLSDVFQFLTEETVPELLEQAALASPIFKTRWRWAANRSLQLLRFHNGKKIPPQISRIRSDDLLASVFPEAAACFENIEGDITVPDHPLVREVMKDVMGEAMDLAGLLAVVRGIRDGSITCLAVDTTTPSVFAHELLHAAPYAFLDDAPLEERRARAVAMRQMLPTNMLDGIGRLDAAAIAAVRDECWPDLRDVAEMHDLLYSVIALPEILLGDERTRHWNFWLMELARDGRAIRVQVTEKAMWVAAERRGYAAGLWNEVMSAGEEKNITRDTALRQAIQGWMQILGPLTARRMSALIAADTGEVFQALLAIEMSGNILRGVFEGTPTEVDAEIEWCDRRLLQRIHKRTLGTLQKQIEPVTPAVFMKWLLRWQHVAPGAQLAGEAGVLQALRQLEGFEAPAVEWERTLLPQRVAQYDPRWLDALCLSGLVGWGRLSPHPAWSAAEGAPRRVVPTSMAPIAFYVRETAAWMETTLAAEEIDPERLRQALSAEAQQVREMLEARGACFLDDLVRRTQLLRSQTERALWELVAAGLAFADSFDALRMLIDVRRRTGTESSQRHERKTVQSVSGRWSLLREVTEAEADTATRMRARDAAIESAARVLLARYGVVFRDLMVRESAMPRWRELLPILRRMEAWGEVRGGRFVSGFGGEQFALADMVSSLREIRDIRSETECAVAAADPMNLVGILVPGEKVSAVPGRKVRYNGGNLAGTAEEVVPDLIEMNVLPSDVALPYITNGYEETM